MKTKHMTRTAILASIAASTSFAFAVDTPPMEKKVEKKVEMKIDGKTAVETTTTTTTPAIEPGTLTTVIQDSVTFSTLTKALKASGLDITLGQKGAFTIFAPTDEAFAKLPAKTLAKLMLPENKEKLRSLLLYHVVAGTVMAADLKDGDVKTMNGEKVKVEVDGDTITINDSKVFSADVTATNGVMHSVGTVIIPESLDGFAKLDN